MLPHFDKLLFLATLANAAAVDNLASRHATNAPTVQLQNGSYYGRFNPTYNQDEFLGMPYAQPPVGDLRFRVPRPLDESWSEPKNATECECPCQLSSGQRSRSRSGLCTRRIVADDRRWISVYWLWW
jgi:hypothetical protein